MVCAGLHHRQGRQNAVVESERHMRIKKAKWCGSEREFWGERQEEEADAVLRKDESPPVRPIW